MQSGYFLFRIAYICGNRQSKSSIPAPQRCKRQSMASKCDCKFKTLNFRNYYTKYHGIGVSRLHIEAAYTNSQKPQADVGWMAKVFGYILSSQHILLSISVWKSY
jgi:hypothetical protein